MLAESEAFSGIAVDDLGRAREFYGETLGLSTSDLSAENGIVSLHVGGGRDVLLYEGMDFRPGSYTVLNFPVADIDAAVDWLTERGVGFERYEGFEQDEKGIARGTGPSIAWFKDPAGNVLSVLEQQPDQG